MGYDPERALLTRVVESRELEPVLVAGMRTVHFGDPDTRDVYDWLVARYERNGTVPSLKLLKVHFPEFEPEKTDDDVEDLITSVKEKKLYVDLQASVKRIAADARDNPEEALRTFKREAGELSIRYAGPGTIDLTKSAGEVRKQYRILERRKGLLGLPWPWARMNRATKGLCKSSYYALYGDPGTMKTWLLIYVLAFVHQHHDARPLFVTQEMPKEDILMRWAALRACVDYEEFKDGKLSKKERRRFYAELDKITEDDSFIVTELDTGGTEAITEIQAKAKEHGANIVGIDGLGDLCDDAEWGSWWDVNKGIKRVAKRLRVPIVGTHHTNRDKRKKPKKYDPTEDEDATDVALGEAMFRYTDGLFTVIRTPQNKENEEQCIRSKKVREGKPCKFFIHARPALDFSQKRSDEEDQTDYEADSDVL